MNTQLTTSSITERLADLGSERWKVHFDARKRAAAGEDIIELTIGEPDIAVSSQLIDVAEKAMRDGRTRYSGGRGEAAMIAAIAAKYSARTGRNITAENVLCLPGTQAALTIAVLSLVETGDSVLLPDPYYATYEGVVRATGADYISVPMRAENGFHLTAEALEAAVLPNSKVLLLNSPHNPTGAVLSASEIEGIGAVCKKHNLWIVSDEVYETLIYQGEFASPFDQADLADRTIVVSSISKSHAAPGFRSGWCVGPAWFTDKMQAVSEALLFGGQPFIADMTAFALTHDIDTANQMSIRYQRRIQLLERAFANCDLIRPLPPEAGMFMLLDISATGLDGSQMAQFLLDNAGVATMPGDAFGQQAKDFVRLSLTVEDAKLEKAASRMVNAVQTLRK